jgi:hypothetical protein
MDVVSAAEDDLETFGPIAAKMDETGSIDGAARLAANAQSELFPRQ